jgi:hypothetical protein
MSTSCIPTMAMFLSLDEFQTFCELKSGGASYHPDEGVCKFCSLILVMSSSSEALLDHIADFLKSMSSPIRSPHCRCRRNAAAAIECPPSATIERRLHRPPLPPPPPPALSTASMSYIGEERGSTTTPTSEPMAAPS